MVQRNKTWAMAGVLAVTVMGCNDPRGGTLTPGQVTGIDVSGTNQFADGTPMGDLNVQYQMIVDGANLFHPGPGGCTQTPAHVAGTIIRNVTSSSAGGYALNVPVGNLHAAVVPQCVIQNLQSGQLIDFRLNASVLATESTCATFCAAEGNPATSCVSDCSTGNRVLQASKTLTRAELDSLIAGAHNGVIHWSQPLVFSTLGPSISDTAEVDLVVDGAGAQASAHVTQESFASTDCEIAESCVRAPGLRTLLRFDGDIENLGSADLVLGDPANNPQFQVSSCHHVNLLQNIMLYELIDPATGGAVKVDGVEIIGRKAGFCMMDIAQVNASAPQGEYDCNNQGITAGWEDDYDSALDCQYLDVTDVPVGNYLLRLTVNPDGVFTESDTTNNSVDVPVTIASPSPSEG